MLKSDAFGLNDLRELTADIGLNWDRLPGDETVQDRALQIALEAAKKNLIGDLVKRMEIARPKIFESYRS